MEKLYFVFFLAICTIPNLSHGECCYKEKLLFQKSDRNLSCAHFGGGIASTNNGVTTPLRLTEYEYNVKYGHCEIFVCQNGRPPGEGTYCGNGPCNIFGCNCDNGCVQGHAPSYFQAIYRDEVYNVR
ncbi:protein Diedel-like [Leptopilina heterotoma]|uniref:protein Diedel-like n=1 Tax=Leptopilina heterotoma TaxID=63436 RepID=UPI001CA85AE4|nr:protein Diedel-like [Leptopilina heterotoma]